MFIIFFPKTGAARVFNSYNLAQETYPNNPIIQSASGVSNAVASWNRSHPKEQCDIYEWYESLFERIDSMGYLTFVDGRVVKAPDGSTHHRPKYYDNAPPEHVCIAFWELAVRASRMTVTRTAPASEKRKGRPTGYTVDLVLANQLLANPPKMPKQCKAIIEYLVGQEYDYYTVAEVQRFTQTPAYLKIVATTQDGWRIWRYYAKTLTELGVLK